MAVKAKGDGMGCNHKDVEYVVTSGSFEHAYKDPNEALLVG